MIGLMNTVVLSMGRPPRPGPSRSCTALRRTTFSPIRQSLARSSASPPLVMAVGQGRHYRIELRPKMALMVYYFCKYSCASSPPSLPNSFHVKHLRPGRPTSHRPSFSCAATKDDEDGGGVDRDGGIWSAGPRRSTQIADLQGPPCSTQIFPYDAVMMQ